MTTDPIVEVPARMPSVPAPMLLRAAALIVAALVGVVCASAWPTVAVALAVLVVVIVLAWRAPSLAFLVAILVSGAVGVLKARLSAEQAPSPNTLGASFVDILLLIGFVSLMASDRGRSLRAVWRAGTRAERIVWALVLAWLAISVLQIPESGHLAQGIKGFRLTQAYVPLVLGGIALVSLESDREKLVKRLLAVFAAVAGYAALRAAIGPASWERGYALAQSQQAELGNLFRAIGSFNSPQDMVSFLVPAGVFALIIGVLNPRVRAFAWLTFVLAAVAVVESYVRVGIVAIGVGAGLLALLVLMSRGVNARTRVIVVMLVILVSGGGYAAARVAGSASRLAATRAGGFSHPLSSAAIQLRWTRWKQALQTGVDHPLGTGIGTVGSATGSASTFFRLGTGRYTDNSYLKVLVEQGIPIGLIFIIGVLGTVVLAGRRLARAGPSRAPVAVAALCGVVSFLVLCLLGDYIEWPGKVVAWTLLGIAIGEASTLAHVSLGNERAFTWRMAKSLTTRAFTR